jgi:hypothetical protein
MSDQRLRHHLRKVASPPPLTEHELARIASALSQAAGRPARRRPWAVVALVAVLTSAAAALLTYHDAAQKRPAMVPLEPEARLVGPGDVTIPEGGAPIALRQGHLSVHSGPRPITIDTLRARVIVHPRSHAELEVRSIHVQVAAYAGKTEVEWLEAGRTIELSAGQTARDEEPERTSEPATSPTAKPASRARPAQVTARGSALAKEDDHDQEPQPTLEAAPLGAESQRLEIAIKLLYRDHDPTAAIAAIEDYRATYATGTLSGEAESLLATAHVIRGEQLLARQRCGEALADFDAAVAIHEAGLAERARRGREACRARENQR